MSMLETMLNQIEEKGPINSKDTVYPLDKILSQATKVVEISEGSQQCWLCFYQKGDYWLDYGFFGFSSSDCDDTNTKVNCIFQGGGTGTLKKGDHSLREFRHTYFGEDGYAFYLPLKETIKALQILNVYFD